MIYVMSDLHGLYDLYMDMLDKIKLKNDDTLYILGDVTDRGEGGVKILLDMMERKNIVPILGNHEYMAYNTLKKLNFPITEENYDKHLDAETMEIFGNWIYNGGWPTCQSFSESDEDVKEKILDYLGGFEIYKELDVHGKSFVLVHGGFKDFRPDKPLDEYSTAELVWGRCDYSRKYYPDKYLVTGHTPTQCIAPGYKGRIYKKNNHIAIDCGASYFGRLGCICLDTFEEFYVK